MTLKEVTPVHVTVDTLEMVKLAMVNKFLFTLPSVIGFNKMNRCNMIAWVMCTLLLSTQ